MTCEVMELYSLNNRRLVQMGATVCVWGGGGVGYLSSTAHSIQYFQFIILIHLKHKDELKGRRAYHTLTTQLFTCQGVFSFAFWGEKQLHQTFYSCGLLKKIHVAISKQKRLFKTTCSTGLVTLEMYLQKSLLSLAYDIRVTIRQPQSVNC